MKVGLVQNNILWENKQFNLNSSRSIFKSAKDDSIDLLLFPEMSFTGFSMDVDIIKDTSLETINYISSLCRFYSINAGIGYVTADNDTNKGRNSYALIDSNGILLCNYNKIHLFSPDREDLYFEKGDKLAFSKINNITISPLICYDLRFPEIFQAASKKAQLIIVAANWPTSRKSQWITLLKARAIENQCFIAGINRIGFGGSTSYSGNSMIVNPDGEILAYGDDGIEDIISCEINPDEFKPAFDTKKDRQEALYHMLNASDN